MVGVGFFCCGDQTLDNPAAYRPGHLQNDKGDPGIQHNDRERCPRRAHDLEDLQREAEDGRGVTNANMP